MKTELMRQLDGVGTDNTGVVLVGATNTPWEIDSALRRRFEKRILVPLPDAAARVEMIKHGIENEPSSLKRVKGHSKSSNRTLLFLPRRMVPFLLRTLYGAKSYFVEASQIWLSVFRWL